MKHVQMKDGRAWKVSDEEAMHLVHTSGAKYISKAQFRAIAQDENGVRDEQDDG